MNILIYGHSQSYGMGIDLTHHLSKAGHKTNRVTKVGWSDLDLKKGIPELTGDPSQYDYIYYVAGANPKGMDKEKISKLILENVATLGGKNKVTVILAPYNDSKEPKDILNDTSTRGYLYEKDLRAAGVKVYRPLFPSSIFEPDTIHVKAGTKIGRDFAAEVIAGGPSKYCMTKETNMVPIIIGAVATVAIIASVSYLWSKR